MPGLRECPPVSPAQVRSSFKLSGVGWGSQGLEGAPKDTTRRERWERAGLVGLWARLR